MPTLRGGCRCGKVVVAFDTHVASRDLQPRACDCAFCREHDASWLSDARGALEVAAHGGALRDARQGSGQARFLLCGDCGVLVAVVLEDPGHTLGAVNARCLGEVHAFGTPVVVSPRKLTADDKRTRWQQVWTPATVRCDTPATTPPPANPAPADAAEGRRGVP